MLRSYSKTVGGAVACLLLSNITAPVYSKPLASNFQLLQGLNCNISMSPGATVAYDSEGEPDKADGLKFICEGKSVPLVSDRLAGGFFTTKGFGKFQVTSEGVFGTKAQNDALIHTYKK